MPGIEEQVRFDLAETSLGRAMRSMAEAAAQRRVGAPICLRCALEVEGDDLVRASAAVVAYAVDVLGPAEDLYAAGAGRREQPAALAHIALTVRHRDGSVALLGVGRHSGQGLPGEGQSGQGPAAPASLFLVGDRGVVEGDPPGASVVEGDSTATAQSPTIRVSQAGTDETGAPSIPAGTAPLERLASAIRRSLESGQLVTVADRAPGDG